MTSWFRSAVLTASIVGLATILSISVAQFSLIAFIERLTEDLRVAVFQAPMSRSNDVVVVAVTEETLRLFRYRSPIDRRFLAELLERIDQAGASAIGLDILLDQATEPEKDDELRRALDAMRTPTVVSYTRSNEIVDERQIDFLDAYLPPPLRATAEFLRDPIDSTVRRVGSGGDGTDPRNPRGLALAIADRLGRPVQNTALEIAWRPRPVDRTPAFAVYPAHTVKDLPPERFQGKVVLIGGIVSLEDRYRTPPGFASATEPLMPGILIHAHAVSQLLDGRRVNRPGPFVLWALSALLALSGHWLSIRGHRALLSLGATLILLSAFWTTALLGGRMGLPMIPLIAPSLALGLSVWFTDLIVGRRERRRRRFLQHAFSRYVSPAVVSQLLKQPDGLKITGQRREASFIFTDITGFTTLAERLAPETLSQVLNDYLEGCCQIILNEGGTVDKFIGDAIMAVFNAPIAQSNHRERALRCAMALDRWAEHFRGAQQERGIELGPTRIGVHSGLALVGNFGSQLRMDFTALGDTVNIASRIEGMNRALGTRILCSETIASSCPSIQLIDLGPVMLPGRSTAIRLFTPSGDDPAGPSGLKSDQATARPDRSASIESAE
ncbi:MAG: hypothetical protein RL322_571 [Pseudomonadota bacterium]|jgi:class 3 adenylate cyclase/CHASE2 domain-containing sensor protein